MRRTRIAATTVMVAAGLIGAVAAPATAGKTRHLVGAFDQQPGSSVSMTVKLNNKGRPKFVKSIRFSALSLVCGSTSRGSGPVEVPGRIPVIATQPPQYGETFKDLDLDADLSDLVVSGALLKKGKLSTGRIDWFGEGSDACFGIGFFEASKE